MRADPVRMGGRHVLVAHQTVRVLRVDAAPGPAGGHVLGPGTDLPPLLLDDEAAVIVAVALRLAASGAVAGAGESAARDR
jgi:predicted DNA-binding transcriptional regulator YafY